MPRKINRSTLNASTIDILNVIRTNASYAYQQAIPTITMENDIPQIGAIIYGNPALSNEFINALVNRIALVAVRSAVFNNPYVGLKKGMLEFGESVENVFVEIVKAMDFSQEKAESRELKRYLPKVHSVFHVQNYNVLYPITIEDEELKNAFLSVDGVSDMIARIIDSVYTGAQYDEYLCTKYLIIKAATAGQIYPSALPANATSDDMAKAFRATSNKLRFMSTEYNEASVPNTTPIERQVIFMDADTNAAYDVDTLAGAFNMEKADFLGRLYLIDSWSTFDNDRFEIITGESTQFDPVTETELGLMEDVKAILADEEWFQIYDKLDKMTETYVAAGDRWNYFYHVKKIYSHSPFANAVMFVNSTADVDAPDDFTVNLGRISNVSSWSTPADTDTFILTMEPVATAGLNPQNVIFTMTDDQVEHGIAISPEGSVFLGKTALTWIHTAYSTATNVTVHAQIGDAAYSAEVDDVLGGILAPDALQSATATWTFELDP